MKSVLFVVPNDRAKRCHQHQGAIHKVIDLGFVHLQTSKTMTNKTAASIGKEACRV